MGLKVISDIPDLVKRSRVLIRRLPPIVANNAKNHFLEGFRVGGRRTDASATGWAKRKKSDKTNKTRRAILVRSGQLRNDIDVRSTAFKRIVIGTESTPYASFHNEGAKNLPQREFLGNSKKLNARLGRIINREFKKAFEL